MNEKFYNLPFEKQQKIINAGFRVFSKNDYKKASTEEIAKEADISKGLLFHYFENKLGLYCFLYEYAAKFIASEMKIKTNGTGVNMAVSFEEETDFFNLVYSSNMEKVKIMKKHPYLYQFLLKSHYTPIPGVSQKLAHFNKDYMGNIIKHRLSNVDYSKFKDNVDVELVVKMLFWFGTGYMKERFEKDDMSLDEIMSEFKSILDLLKNNLYKEEFVNECY